MNDDLFIEPAVVREIYFEVRGEVRGKGRPRTRVVMSKQRPGTGFASIYTDQKTKQYEARIASAAMIAKAKANWYGIADAMPTLRMDVLAMIGIPVSRSKKETARLDGMYSDSRIDGDNIIKAICDACQGVLFTDDKIIAVMTVTKRWVADGSQEGLRVKVSTCV